MLPVSYGSEPAFCPRVERRGALAVVDRRRLMATGGGNKTRKKTRRYSRDRVTGAMLCGGTFEHRTPERSRPAERGGSVSARARVPPVRLA